MKSAHRVAACCVLACSVAGCATPRAGLSSGAREAVSVNATVDRAKQAAHVGASKAEVIAALGAATVVRFATGYEVWVYRLAVDEPGKKTSNSRTAVKEQGKASTETLSEFVILFAPSGTVVESRLRTMSPA
jgi:hypothetical protein